MPLHGKIVVIKRGGGDGTDFPLTATCLFGRKPDCDIRIQLPQVSKEHCRIDLNENKEVVLTNLSSVNPTKVNGEVLQQSERLKHGDIITIIDRSFRFEYPPAPTPKKRTAVGGKNETLKALQDQHVTEKGITETGEKRLSVVSTDPPLKDGTNHDNIQRCMDKTMELESNETSSPFSDLYQMIKKSLDVKTPRKSTASLLQTPTSRFCTPNPVSVKKNYEIPITSTGDKSTPKRVESEVLSGAAAAKINNTTPKSVKKQRESLKVSSNMMVKPEAQNVVQSGVASPLRRHSATNQRPTVSEGNEKDNAQIPKSPMRRRSKEATPAKPAVTSPKTDLKRVSPRNSGKVQTVNETSKKRKSGELAADLPEPQMKKKRVSFGGHLTPELFDKRLPPDSPLRRGATPRRSLCLFKPKQSLLRRASVIGLLQEFEHENPDRGAAESPKNPSSAKKASPKARSPSPKAVTPGKQSPKSRSPSPKAVTPAKKSPKSKSLSPAKGRSPSVSKVGTPACQTPTVQGRFSVSRIRTPSPLEETFSTNEGPLDTETPKLASRRKSSARKSQGVGSSAVKAKCRRSSISRASLKAIISWADRVKFGRAKSQVAVPAKMRVTKEIVKKSVPKPKTPARKLESYASTGHANSPATIVVGRAHRQKIVHPTGAAPRLVTNMAVLKKDMKMDEDLTGIAEMYKTPVTKKRSVINENSTVKTPAGDLGTSVVEPSVLNTPEELGEMMVSPLSVSSTVKDGRYNSEAVQRLFNEDHESSLVGEVLPVVTASEAQQHTDSDISATTPKQKPKLPDCLTGVKRIMKTPKQKAEPIEDLRGKILKTPKQKPVQQECLTGVKRIMKTPKQKAEPIEDLRGKIMKTPKQKPVEQECLTGVKRIMKTPKQKAEPIEDLGGKILKTPKQKQLVQQECLTGVKRIMKTPKQKSEPVEDLRGKILKTPKQKLEPQECLTGVKRIFDTPQAEAKPLEEPQDELEVCSAEEAGEASSDGVEENLEMLTEKQVSEELPKMTNMETQRVRTPREKSAPVEDFVAMRRLVKTPRQKYQAVEEKFGIKRLVKTPRQKVDAPVEDFEGLKELMEEPDPEPTGQLETNEVEDQTSDCREEIANELNIAHKEPQNDVQSNVADVPDVEMEAGAEKKEAVADDHLEQLPHKSSDTKETITEVAVDDKLPIEEHKVNTSDDKLSEETPEMETTSGQEIESATDPAPEVKSVRGRRGENVGTKLVEEKCEALEPSENSVIPASVRGRRGKKTEATAPPTVRQTTRGRNAKTTESTDAEIETYQDAPLPSKVALKPKRGRGAKQASAEQAEIVQEVDEAKVPEPEAELSDVNQESNDDTAPVEKVVVKPRRGRRAKPSVQTEQEEVPSAPDDLPQTDKSEETDSKEVVPSENDENKSSDVIESPQAPEEEAAPCKVTEIDAPVVEKKSVRGRRAKVVESKSPEDKDEVTEHSENSVVSAPVRGRRGKKTEAAAPPAVRQTKRGRNAKSDDSTCDQPDTNTEAASDQNSAVEAIQEENEPEPQPKESVVKPTRGRKTKTAIAPPRPESEKTLDASEELPKEDAQPQQPVPSLGKSRRGKRTAVDTVEQPEVAEDTAATVEAKESSKPPARARRGRNAKQEEEKPESNDKTVLLETTEPVKKSRRTRKAEEDPVEQREAQSSEITVPHQAKTPEPVKMTEQANTATKPRRGGRKAKQDGESETPVESTDVQEIPAVSTTEKPKRGRRGKKVPEEAEVTTVVPEETPDCEPEPEAEEKKTTEPEAPASKPGRGRAAKKEVSQVPAKRARRGAAPPDSESNTESTDQVSESEVISVEPPKRGRRAAAKAVADETTVTSDQANPNEDSQSAVVEDDKKTKRSVKWKTDLEVFEIQKVTPVKAVRGRKSKFGDRVGSESQNLPEKACITEEKDLSDNAVEAQPAKRARRGAKIVPTDDDQSTSRGKDVEAETQPKTRRGRSAKK